MYFLTCKYNLYIVCVHMPNIQVHIHVCSLISPPPPHTSLSSLSLSLPPSLPSVVQRIRTAPSPSTFVIGEDEALRQQVLALLRKQERRAAAKRAIAAAQGEGGGGGGEMGESRSHKKPSVSSVQGEERRKKREK